MGRQREVAEPNRAKTRRARLRARQSGDAGERAKANFLSVISHELRTPLNTILGQADLLAGDSLSPSMREAVDAIRDAGQGLNATLNDVLLLAKLEAGDVADEHAEFDIRALAEGVQRICRPKAWAQNLDLELIVDRAVPRRLVGDAGRIRQTLMNLAGNALKFTERGGVSISVQMAADRSMLKVSVADSGIGLSNADRHRLFVPFEQIHAPLARPHGGLGLGLALCKRLVTAMGGTIGVESEAGVGSVFWFTAPVKSAAVAYDPHVAEDEAMLDLATISHLRGMKILVADDNALHRDVLARLFEAAQISPVFVEDGLQAVAAAGGANFDAILLDAHMPLAGGAQAARMIRTLQRHAKTPILIACPEGDSPEAELMGFCDGIARKPYAPRALLGALIAACGQAGGDAPFDSAPIEDLERSVGRAVLVDILKSFIGTAAEVSLQIADAAELAQPNTLAISQAARDLAGASSGLGLVALSAAAKALSAAARQDQSSDLVSQALALVLLSGATSRRLVLLYPDLQAA